MLLETWVVDEEEERSKGLYFVNVLGFMIGGIAAYLYINGNELMEEETLLRKE